MQIFFKFLHHMKKRYEERCVDVSRPIEKDQKTDLKEGYETCGKVIKIR